MPKFTSSNVVSRKIRKSVLNHLVKHENFTRAQAKYFISKKNVAENFLELIETKHVLDKMAMLAPLSDEPEYYVGVDSIKAAISDCIELSPNEKIAR